MKMKLISLNVRGVGDDNKRKVVKVFLKNTSHTHSMHTRNKAEEDGKGNYTKSDKG